MTMPMSGIVRGSRTWLSGLMFVLSAPIWLSVSSNRNNILHTIGKLGFATNGYGTVNLPLLLFALCWSVGGCFFAAIIYDIDLKRKSVITLLLDVAAVVAVTAAVGIFFDEWFSISLLSALLAEISGPIIAGLLGWNLLFKRSNQNVWSVIIGSSLFGLFALIFVTSLGLLICPRVSFRI
jgi:hypothetical protein